MNFWTDQRSVVLSQVFPDLREFHEPLVRDLRHASEQKLTAKAAGCNCSHGGAGMLDQIQDELNGLDLGDHRLDSRCKDLLFTLYSDPMASINAACQGKNETQAAYRFFDNDFVDPAAILAPHQAATAERIKQHSVVLFAQDTTEYDFSSHPPAGSGPLNSAKHRGYLDHTQLALTPEGLCLGVVSADIWAREEEGFGKSKQRQYDAFETKETYRWLEGYQTACEWQKRLPETQIVSVADCEGDIYELFTEVDKQADSAADFVIRSGKVRCLRELDPTAKPGSKVHLKLHQALDNAPVIAHRELNLPRTPKRDPRVATVEIRATRIELKAPHRPHDPQPDVSINVVLIRETNAAPGVEPLEWCLLTSLPIETEDEVLRVVNDYTGRWPIEVYFRTSKTGCAIEKIQLETTPRLLRCLMLYKIIAWRIQYVTMLGRECPNLPCDAIFPADEWKPVWKIIYRKKPLPKTAPKLGQFILMLGQLGGHNGRKNDPPPGAQAIWTGIRRMTDFSIAWQAFGPEETITTDGHKT